jgi:SAM-dependent methyltransferase
MQEQHTGDRKGGAFDLRSRAGGRARVGSMDEEDGYFDERVAAAYEEASPELFAPEAVDPAVDFLLERAANGRVLEFGVGTGRIALPLTARGVPVHGIELSKAMVSRLRSKSGSDAVEVSIGDFSTRRVEGAFSLVYLVFNTIMNLTTQAAQVACFRNAAAHLQPGGRFVIEVGVPELRRLPAGETFQVFAGEVLPGGGSSWGIDEYDVANQGLVSHHLREEAGHLERFSVPFRYVWPSELDLMAELAGMTLRERWAGWRREPFTSESRQHVSVWELPGHPNRGR